MNEELADTTPLAQIYQEKKQQEMAMHSGRIQAQVQLAGFNGLSTLAFIGTLALPQVPIQSLCLTIQGHSMTYNDPQAQTTRRDIIYSHQIDLIQQGQVVYGKLFHHRLDFTLPLETKRTLAPSCGDYTCYTVLIDYQPQNDAPIQQIVPLDQEIAYYEIGNIDKIRTDSSLSSVVTLEADKAPTCTLYFDRTVFGPSEPLTFSLQGHTNTSTTLKLVKMEFALNEFYVVTNRYQEPRIQAYGKRKHMQWTFDDPMQLDFIKEQKFTLKVPDRQDVYPSGHFHHIKVKHKIKIKLTFMKKVQEKSRRSIFKKVEEIHEIIQHTLEVPVIITSFTRYMADRAYEFLDQHGKIVMKQTPTPPPMIPAIPPSLVRRFSEQSADSENSFILRPFSMVPRSQDPHASVISTEVPSIRTSVMPGDTGEWLNATAVALSPSQVPDMVVKSHAYDHRVTMHDYVLPIQMPAGVPVEKESSRRSSSVDQASGKKWIARRALTKTHRESSHIPRTTSPSPLSQSLTLEELAEIKHIPRQPTPVFHIPPPPPYSPPPTLKRTLHMPLAKPKARPTSLNVIQLSYLADAFFQELEQCDDHDFMQELQQLPLLDNVVMRDEQGHVVGFHQDLERAGMEDWFKEMVNRLGSTPMLSPSALSPGIIT